MRWPDFLLPEAPELPEDERARLALRLAQSLEDTKNDSEDAWAREVARRIERLRNGTARTVPTEQALEQARGRLAGRANR